MEEKNLSRLVRRELEEGKDRLQVASLLLKEGKLKDAVNRAYYAAYHSAKALLHSIGQDAKTHSGLITSIGLHLIERKRLKPKYGSYLRDLYEARESSNYLVEARFERQEVKELVKKAKEFLRKAIERSQQFLKRYER